MKLEPLTSDVAFFIWLLAVMAAALVIVVYELRLSIDRRRADRERADREIARLNRLARRNVVDLQSYRERRQG